MAPSIDRRTRFPRRFWNNRSRNSNMPTVPEPLRMSGIFGTFGATRFSQCTRGNRVPNYPANYGVADNTAGLRFSQFHGATTDNPAPPAPRLDDTGWSDSVFSATGSAEAKAEIWIDASGWVRTFSLVNGGGGNQFQWLPAGRSPGEYQVRSSTDNGASWSGWQSLSNNFMASMASASTDGFYGDYNEWTALVQIGANGQPLSRTATFYTSATASGRG